MIKLEDQCEFIGQIMDCIEDFLQEKGISFPETRQMMIDAGCSEEEIDENDAILYGDNYSNLSESIESVLMNWDILERY